jgi:hypothetical protein
VELLGDTCELADANAGRLPDLLRRIGEAPVDKFQERAQILAHQVSAAFGEHLSNKALAADNRRDSIFKRVP